jgi:DNA-binding transcriptional LysR family regulator
MELRHLRYFVAVAEELHFRRAAERLHVAQPAVSEQVRKLEEELGVTLLERTHRSVSLTDAGAAMLDQARSVLRLADAAQHAARSAPARSSARLRVGYAASVLPAAVPRALQAIRKSSTPAEVTLEAGSTDELIEAVRDDRLHAVVIPLPARAQGLRVTKLSEQRAVAVLPVSDVHAAQRRISLSQLDSERLFVLPREANRPFYDAVIAGCHEAGISPSIIELPSDEVEQVLLTVASGAGMALVPESVAERYAAPGARFIQLDEPRPAFVTGVVTRRNGEHFPTSSFLRALSRTASPRPPGPIQGRPLAVVAA